MVHLHPAQHRRARPATWRRGQLLGVLLAALAVVVVLQTLLRRRRPAVWHEAQAPEPPRQPANPAPMVPAPLLEDLDLVLPAEHPRPAAPPRRDPVPTALIAEPVTEPLAGARPSVHTEAEPEPRPGAEPTVTLELAPDPEPARVGIGARPVLRPPPPDAPAVDVPISTTTSVASDEEEGWGISVLQQCLIAAGILAAGLLAVFLLQLLLH